MLSLQEAAQDLAHNEDMPTSAGWTQIAGVSLTTEEIDQYDELLKHALRPVQLKFTERRGDATMFILGSSCKADLSMELAVFLRVLCVLWVHLLHGEACREQFFMRESGQRWILGKRLAETEQIEELIIGKVISDRKCLASCVHWDHVCRGTIACRTGDVFAYAFRDTLSH